MNKRRHKAFPSLNWEGKTKTDHLLRVECSVGRELARQAQRPGLHPQHCGTDLPLLSAGENRMIRFPGHPLLGFIVNLRPARDTGDTGRRAKLAGKGT